MLILSFCLAGTLLSHCGVSCGCYWTSKKIHQAVKESNFYLTGGARSNALIGIPLWKSTTMWTKPGILSETMDNVCHMLLLQAPSRTLTLQLYLFSYFTFDIKPKWKSASRIRWRSLTYQQTTELWARDNTLSAKPWLLVKKKGNNKNRNQTWKITLIRFYFPFNSCNKYYIN